MWRAFRRLAIRRGCGVRLIRPRRRLLTLVYREMLVVALELSAFGAAVAARLPERRTLAPGFARAFALAPGFTHAFGFAFAEVALCGGPALPAWVSVVAAWVGSAAIASAGRKMFAPALGSLEAALPVAVVRASVRALIKRTPAGGAVAVVGFLGRAGGGRGEAWSALVLEAFPVTRALVCPVRGCLPRPALIPRAPLTARCAISRLVGVACRFSRKALLARWSAAVKWSRGAIPPLATFIGSCCAIAALILIVLVGRPGALKAWRGASLALVMWCGGVGARTVIRVPADGAVLPRAVNSIAAETRAHGSGRLLLFAVSV